MSKISQYILVIIFMYFFNSLGVEAVEKKSHCYLMEYFFETKKCSDIYFENGKSYVLKMKVGKLDRFFKVYISKTAELNKKSPLLFVFHGGGGNMQRQAMDPIYKQISGADLNKAILVFPNGYTKSDSQRSSTWNAGGCCGEARELKTDEISFIRNIISYMKTKLLIDDKKIFATGMSNGGMLAFKLACEMSQEFSKVASVTGTDMTNECRPKKNISILLIHAKDDDQVNYYGGAGENAHPKELNTKFTSVPKTMEKWIKLNKCNKKPKIVLKNDNVKCEEYSPCGDNSILSLCTLEKGGHNWPGGNKPKEFQHININFHATEYMWKFFNR